MPKQQTPKPDEPNIFTDIFQDIELDFDLDDFQMLRHRIMK